MPKKACCCVAGCCDPIFFTDFITIAGETLDDAVPVSTDDIVILVMNRPGSFERSPTTMYGVCPTGVQNLDCFCMDCEYLRANWCSKYCDCLNSTPGYCQGAFEGSGCAGNIIPPP
jgi:hypothetical protein